MLCIPRVRFAKRGKRYIVLTVPSVTLCYNNGKTVNGFRYYRALESVSIAGERETSEGWEKIVNMQLLVYHAIAQQESVLSQR